VFADPIDSTFGIFYEAVRGKCGGRHASVYSGTALLQCNRSIATVVSVRPSPVTRWYCVETNEATIMRFSLSGSKITLVSGEVKIVAKFAGDHP